MYVPGTGVYITFVFFTTMGVIIIVFILKKGNSVTQRDQILIIRHICTHVAIHKQVGLCRKEVEEKNTSSSRH